MIWGQILIFAFVEPVVGYRENVAVGKDSVQSSTHSNIGYAQYANDGNRFMEYDYKKQEYCAHTMLNKPEYWWAVNLGEVYIIDTITIYFRLIKPERMSNFFLYVYDGKEVTDWESFEMSSANLCFRQNGIPPPIFNFACDKRTKGRYMKLYKQYRYLPGDDALVLCEFEVYPKQGTRTEVTENIFCPKPHNEPLHQLSVVAIPRLKIEISCSLICVRQSNCLGFAVDFDEHCRLYQTSRKGNNGNILSYQYYEKC